MTKPLVAVLRGGPSSEYDVSLRTGAGMLSHIDRERFAVRDIVIRKDITWTSNGRVFASPQEALDGVDVALIGLHGTYGEDGTVQALLDENNIPYVGTGAAASRIGMSKALTHAKVVDVLKSPVVVAPRYVIAQDMWRTQGDMCMTTLKHTVGFPCVVKPVHGGSSLGVTIIRDDITTDTIKKCEDAISVVVDDGDDAVIERYSAGREVTCAVVEGLNGKDIQALPLVEVVLDENQPFFDYDAKYSGKTREICPARVDAQTRRAIANAAITIHATLGLRDYSRSDFIVGDDGTIVFLEVNTLPGMTPTSFVPQALAAIGVSYTAFITHLITRALDRGKK